MSERAAVHGVYLVTDRDRLPDAELGTRIAAIINAGVGWVQYRDKTDDHERRLGQAHALARLCDRLGARLIVNDDAELAAEAGASGVHLGEADTSVADARNRLGPQAVIGASCYNDVLRGKAAQAEGADYAAFGSVFPSPTKPDARRASPALISEAKAELDIPVVAIGGITPENAAEVVAAGADAIAVVGGILDAPDPAAAASSLAGLFGDVRG
jgi:thiamine-phosphate pyrophosphorylase